MTDNAVTATDNAAITTDNAATATDYAATATDYAATAASLFFTIKKSITPPQCDGVFFVILIVAFGERLEGGERALYNIFAYAVTYAHITFYAETFRRD